MGNLTDDIDQDGLTNAEEYSFGANPIEEDTDIDRLSDREEVAGNPSDASIIYNSNPLIYDSDNDGWNDFRERYNDLDDSNLQSDNTTNPLIKDTDGDGLNDPEDLDPLNASGDGIISGRIFKKAVYDQNGTKQVYFRNAKDAEYQYYQLGRFLKLVGHNLLSIWKNRRKLYPSSLRRYQ